ncbi:MAG TPA: hypothetical protein VGQ88_03215 [Burkholderiales bacterium]|nr:hypothetical protein [Burkholderiales bacterium]
MRDAFAAWKEGLPAVVLVHEPFVTLAKAQCQALGAKDPTLLVYQQDAPARESDEQSTDKARHVAAEVVKLLSRKS